MFWISNKQQAAAYCGAACGLHYFVYFYTFSSIVDTWPAGMLGLPDRHMKFHCW